MAWWHLMYHSKSYHQLQAAEEHEPCASYDFEDCPSCASFEDQEGCPECAERERRERVKRRRSRRSREQARDEAMEQEKSPSGADKPESLGIWLPEFPPMLGPEWSLTYERAKKMKTEG